MMNLIRLTWDSYLNNLSKYCKTDSDESNLPYKNLVALKVSHSITLPFIILKKILILYVTVFPVQIPIKSLN